MTDAWMVYGAYGYTGRLIVARAVAAGMKPVVAGRDADKLESLALEFGLSQRCFDVGDVAALRKGLDGMRAVLNCAGPFSRTASAMISACLQLKVHYLDITGEIDVFAYAHSNDSAARKHGIALIPGVGFDVVPTDCLAAMLARELPDANELILAFDAGGGPSRGTALTTVEGVGGGGRVRREGQVVRVPLAYKQREFNFANGRRMAVTIPWGDVYTAFVSTGIPNIEVYMSMSTRAISGMRKLRWFAPLLTLAPAQWLLKRQVSAGVSGPTPERRATTQSQVYGEVRNAAGQRRAATLVTPNGYDLTAIAAVEIAEFLVKDRRIHAGYFTPSTLMGADFVTTLPGVEYARVNL